MNLEGVNIILFKIVNDPILEISVLVLLTVNQERTELMLPVTPTIQHLFLHHK